MRTRRRAWALADAVMAIGILVVLTGIIGVEMNWRARAAKHLENTRIATDDAELVLSQMQQGHPPRLDGSDVVLVERIAGADIPNWQWVSVTARHGDRTATLIGLVKADAMGGH